MATKPRPSWVAATPQRQHQNACENPISLTERDRAGNLAGEVPIIIPRRACIRHRHRSEERIHAQSLHLKYLIRLLHNLPQTDRFLQLGFPFQPRLGGLGIQGVQASQSTVVVNRTRIYCSCVVDGVGTRARTGRSDVLVWTIRIFFATEG